MKIRRTVDSFLNTGIYTPIGMYELAEDVVIGTLVGFNNNGLLVSVEKVENKDIRAVGIITEGSTVTVDDPRYLPNGKNYKELGDFQELYRQFKIMGVTNFKGATGNEGDKWKFSDIGTPVYLEEGKLVAVPTGGKKSQKIGILGDPTRREILCTLIEDLKTR